MGFNFELLANLSQLREVLLVPPSINQWGVGQMKKVIFGILLVTILSITLVLGGIEISENGAHAQPQASGQRFFDDFDGQSLGSGWNVEDLGGNYSLSSGILTLSSTGVNTGLGVI